MTPTGTRAVILAAGRGSRMGNLTDRQPKCRLRLAGASLLDWQLRALRRAGAGPLAVVRGYRGEQVAGDGWTHFENPDWATSGIFWSLWQARSWLRSSPCLVSYGDIVYHPDILSELLNCPHDIAITYDECWLELWRRRFTNPANDAETLLVDSGRLVEIGGPVGDLAQVQGQYMGLLKFRPEGWWRLEEFLARCDGEWTRRTDMTGLLRRLTALPTLVAAVPIQGRWCEVDSADDLRLYEGILASGEAWNHDWRF